ncbi:MAG TPA: CHAT domain-containing protein [Vicinamibacterales bacterium]|nr:CHAT domain-containing protein [Vicinamibacterales bacterium]
MTHCPHFTLELLRGGPPHNQLVSPITEYLALCGGAAPHTLRLPFEHGDLTNRLLVLRYGLGNGRDQEVLRQSEISRLARELGGLLGSIPAFGAEISSLELPLDGGVVHFRLVLAGNELGLVPWEIAHVPVGLPGAGLPMLLQPRVPVSMTREVRGSSRRRFQWDRAPRILFATADDRDFPANTVEAHLLALRRALEPWAYPDRAWQPTSYPIDIIEQASVEKIRQRCLDQDYTHVHILAHGAPVDAQNDVRFGLRLHANDNSGKRIVATGEQLAHAVLPSRSRKGASDPVLVSLATCDSANQTAVITPGGSIAHQLHHMGVPWVVASQFPLTVLGSVVLVEDLYNELLQGTDPRIALHRIRQHLATQFGDRHDWATLVAYASFPTDFDVQVGAFRRRAVYARRNRASILVDRAVVAGLLEGGA